MGFDLFCNLHTLKEVQHHQRRFVCQSLTVVSFALSCWICIVCCVNIIGVLNCDSYVTLNIGPIYHLLSHIQRIVFYCDLTYSAHTPT